ncbi:MAG: N-acetyltransferase [Armatimonadetes bacterium]|nr:N-acetyltransferase [Armatimonadota bacterium]
MEIRKARIADVPGIAKLINRQAGIGNVLPRSEEELCDALRDFFVAEVKGGIVGCSSLKIMGGDLAEVRSLVVADEAQGTGLGKSLVNACLEEAAVLGLSCVFALTAVPHFFEKLGFRQVPRSTFPQKIWRDCSKCKFFEACREVAVQYDLTPVLDRRIPAGRL